MPEYFLAPSLVGFRDEINKRFPKRDKSSDGWIGDASHAARPSSHNPDWGAPGKWRGVVRAIDVDIDDNDAGADLRKMVIKAAVGDPRVWYVISNGIIYSATYGWQARKYTGSNGHYKHVHISLKETVGAWSNDATWLGPQPADFKVKPGAVDVRGLLRQFKIAAKLEAGAVAPSNSVGRIQAVLNKTIGTSLKVDGVAGPATLAAWKKWEVKRGGTGHSSIPDAESLTDLARGRFSLTNPNWLLTHPVVPAVRKVKTIVSWNVYVGSTSKNVEKGIRTIIQRHRPEVLALQEISGDIKMLSALAKELGYNFLVSKRAAGAMAGIESQSTGMFVHKAVPLTTWSALRMKLTWLGPVRRLQRPGRTFITANAGGTQVTALHMPTGRGTKRNQPAWTESIQKLLSLAKRAETASRPFVLIGDWNVAKNDKSTGSAQALAKRIGGAVVAGSGKIDYAVTRGVRAKGFTGDKLGSDHNYFVLTLS